MKILINFCFLVWIIGLLYTINNIILSISSGPYSLPVFTTILIIGNVIGVVGGVAIALHSITKHRRIDNVE